MARPPYSLFRVVVESTELVTPHMKRITVDGSALPAFRAGLPAQWLKVFVPGRDPEAKMARAYTVRRFDPVSNRLQLDFVLHGDNGPASAWATRAQAGDPFEISTTHPRSGFAIRSDTEHYLLCGDETALPAIGSILEALPAHARADVFVEVEDAGEEQCIDTAATVNVTWLHRNGLRPGTLEEAGDALGRPDDRTMVWIAAESSIVRSLRSRAAHDWAVSRDRLHASGYWKRGEPDHRDQDAMD